MRKLKFIAILLVLVLLVGGMMYAGLTSRQSAMAGVQQAPRRNEAVQREIDETSRIVNGQKR